MKANKARKHKSKVLSALLTEITPTDERQTETKLSLATRLEDLIKLRGWGKSEFAEKLSKSPSEISKWLSGTHNFTIDTLSEIAMVLGMQVADLFALKQVQSVNRAQVIIHVGEIPSGIQYITPVGKSVMGLMEPYSELHSCSYSHLEKGIRSFYEPLESSCLFK